MRCSRSILPVALLLRNGWRCFRTRFGGDRMNYSRPRSAFASRPEIILTPPRPARFPPLPAHSEILPLRMILPALPCLRRPHTTILDLLAEFIVPSRR